MTFKSRCVFRGDGTCSARFLPFYSFSLYAFIFIKGILLLFILCFNSLSRLPLKRRHSRRVFFTRRSSPVTRIKKMRQHIVVAFFLVEVTGLEPTTSWSRTKRATKLRYTSIPATFYIILHYFIFCNCFIAF